MHLCCSRRWCLPPHAAPAAPARTLFRNPYCIDPTALRAGNAKLTLAPDSGQLVNTQHIKVGTCEAYILYWQSGSQSYDKELITNCAPTATPSPPDDCLLERSGGGGIDKVAVTMNCVCVAAEESAAPTVTPYRSATPAADSSARELRLPDARHSRSEDRNEPLRL